MRRNAAKCGAFLAHFGSIRAILVCFEMRRNAAADPNAAHFGAFRRHARRIMQLTILYYYTMVTVHSEYYNSTRSALWPAGP